MKKIPNLEVLLDAREMANHYVVEWRGPFSFEEVLDEEGWEDTECLYTITHEPPIRDSKLLYIGSATKRYIGTRLSYYHKNVERIREKYGDRSVFYYLGSIRLRTGKSWSRKRALDVEAAIIFGHADLLEFNKQNTETYDRRLMVLTNIGDVPPDLMDFQMIEES
ncbi:MAG: hypothetical protein KAR33_01530 [Candidatus Thorarchaeota archaeon]|nr:hypothetical protein [Candidatus Thorarchaeota archaeon]